MSTKPIRETTTLFRANDGQRFPTYAEAQSHNSYLTFERSLEEEFGIHPESIRIDTLAIWIYTNYIVRRRPTPKVITP